MLSVHESSPTSQQRLIVLANDFTATPPRLITFAPTHSPILLPFSESNKAENCTPLQLITPVTAVVLVY